MLLAIKALTVTILTLSICLTPSRADNVIKSGTTVKINSGTSLISVQDVLVENGGTLNIKGSLILKNDFINSNMVQDLGKGVLEFSGTSAQNIAGQNTIGKLVVYNPAGLNLLDNITVNSELSLINGSIRLGINNLTLGKMATVSGTPSASSMIVATESGELRKCFSDIRQFVYPIGDEAGTPDYTPVTLDFSKGTFSSDNFVGINLKNIAFAGYAGNNLNRYWTLSQYGVTDFLYNVTFQYVSSDITKIENELLCVQVEPIPMISFDHSNTNLHQLNAKELNSFGIFTGINSKELTGIPSNIATHEFKCFPNPFTDEITIDINNSKNEEMNVEIYNISGQLIKNLYRGIANENLILKWEAKNESRHHLSPGVYLVKVNGRTKQVIYENAKK